MRGWLLILTCLHVLSKQPVMALPLSTQSRWIVNENGIRVKLACVNWPSHLQPMLAEGLGKQPLDVISKKIRTNGFNCVRFTWPLELVTNQSLTNLTVHASLQSLGLAESVGAITVNNPSFLDLTLIQAFQAVVRNLGDNDVMVILDNHVTKAGWCCGSDDGNGFFGDRYFDPNEWLTGLKLMASMFNGTQNVVGMSLRNELRGPKQNVTLWYRYMQEGAEEVHTANPNVLVILSGLSYDTDLTFLKTQPVNITFTNKLVFELHHYGFTDGSSWETSNPNKACGRLKNNLMNNAMFLLDQGFPMFVSEFGGDLRGGNVNDNRFLNCMIGLLAAIDLDWAWWALQGSYYLRQGVFGLDEVYGVLTWNWSGIRNSTFMERLNAIQPPFRGPGISAMAPYDIIFHPASGFCVLKHPKDSVRLGSCNQSMAWIYTRQQTIMVKGTRHCLQALGMGLPLGLGVLCTNPASKWEMISDSKLHLSSKLRDGSTVCLDVGSEGVLVTNVCNCLSNSSTCDPANQWFKVVNSTRSLMKIPTEFTTAYLARDQQLLSLDIGVLMLKKNDVTLAI